ncbi:MAG: hypothetical protein RJB01_766 [Actinomycetota bacterium]
MSPEATSIADLSFTDIAGNEVSLAQYAGKPILIVNTASKCGFTPQYQGLQELHEELGPLGLVVLGFPCDQFAHQEPGDEGEIAEFCSRNYGVSFPLSAKVSVNGAKTHPIFAFLKKHAGGRFGSAVKWNFTKFLVAPDGTTVMRFAPSTAPADVAEHARAMLEQ